MVNAGFFYVQGKSIVDRREGYLHSSKNTHFVQSFTSIDKTWEGRWTCDIGNMDASANETTPSTTLSCSNSRILVAHYRSFLSRSLFITAVLNSSDPFFNERNTPRNTRHWTRASPYLWESIHLDARESFLERFRPITGNDNRESNDERDVVGSFRFAQGNGIVDLELFFTIP